MVLRPSQLVRVQVFYYIPGTRIITEFYWETDDVPPELRRVHKFLRYWHENIDAIISDVLVSTKTGDWRAIDSVECFH